ncbi:MAG: HAD-IA family hydrolase [Planctomycetota bacterium]
MLDLGRVLLRIAEDWPHAYQLAGLAHLTPPQGDISSAERRGDGRESERLFAGFETGRTSVQDYLRVFARDLGVTVHQASDLIDAWLIEPFDRAEWLIEELLRRDVMAACLSNTNAHHWRLLTDPSHRSYLPLHRLDHVFASQLIGHAKPGEGAYRHVEVTTGIARGHTLFFDDLPENIESARRRGWHGVVIERGPEADPIAQVVEELTAYGVW